MDELNRYEDIIKYAVQHLLECDLREENGFTKDIINMMNDLVNGKVKINIGNVFLLQRDDSVKYDVDLQNNITDIGIYKDLETGKKGHRYIMKPDFDYYKLKPEYTTDHNLFIVEKEKVDKITCKYKDLLKSIAENTGNEEFFYENLRTGQFRNNQLLHELPNILFSDSNIEDRYKFMFDLYYKNDICPITKAFFDIEVDTINMKGDFPEMGECPINAVSCIIEQENLVKVFLLRNPNNPLIEKFEHEAKIDPNLFKELREV